MMARYAWGRDEDKKTEDPELQRNQPARMVSFLMKRRSASSARVILRKRLCWKRFEVPSVHSGITHSTIPTSTSATLMIRFRLRS